MFSVLEGAASGLASAGIQQMFTDYNREQDFGNYQKAQEQNFVNAQDAQRNAPMLTKLGMQAAGLNPVGMSNPNPASPVSAPLGSYSSPNVQLAQDNNLMADARLKNAEAEKTELENDQIHAENESSFQNYKQQIQALASVYSQRGFTEQAEDITEELQRLEELQSKGQLNWNVGNLRGAVNAFATVDKLQERLTNTLDQVLKTETNYKMLVGNQSVSLSKMPEVQRKLLMAQTSANIAQASLMMSQKSLTQEQINECVKMQEKIEADINRAVAEGQLTRAEANNIRNSDWKSLMADGEYLKAIIAKADQTEQAILQQMGTFAQTYVGAKTGGKIAESLRNNGERILKGADVTKSPIITPHKGAIHQRTILKNGVPSSTYDFDDYSY